jgi:hypothetical protein
MIAMEIYLFICFFFDDLWKRNIFAWAMGSGGRFMLIPFVDLSFLYNVYST